jgi:hypothetical protein
MRWITVVALLFVLGSTTFVLLSQTDFLWNRPIPDFDPERKPNQIMRINHRMARKSLCAAEDQSASALVRASDTEARFADMVLHHGAETAGIGAIELNPEALELSIDIAVREGRLSAERRDALQRKAERQLFKPGGRSFIVLNGGPGVLRLARHEPSLLSQRNGEGRLVGMSVEMAKGLRPGQLGLLIFEDRVCHEDLSYALVLPVVTDDHRTRSSFLGMESNDPRTFSMTIGGDDEPRQVLQALYGKYTPRAPQPNRVQDPASRVSVLGAGDVISAIGLALDVVKFIASF